MKYPKVAVVIVHWNRKNLLEKFLPAVVASDYPNMEVVLADNASDDGSVAFVQRHFPEVKIIVNEQNYGYAGGYNQALMQVKADYYVLLNNDIEVPRGWIEPVIEAMESDSSIGACQPKMLDY
ncbi:MAG: glycosyltransferase family 2 protein, partial [Bacteroidia bacterium]|nr:glycosyltransferase family 2 protein [Bacteroidia bacterium]